MRQRGATLILFTFLTAMLMIPIIGLAIDGSIVFWMRTKLTTAVDAAALATARGLNVNQTLGSQNTNANSTGQSYFWANFPSGMMGTTVVGGEPTVNIASSTNSTLTATVSASLTVPLYFMRLLHFNSITLGAVGTASRRVTNVILVIDRSYSMQQANACSTMIASAQNFVNDFVDGRDTLGLITFQATANVDFAPTTSFKSSNPNLNSVLGTAVCTGYTSTASALNLAYTKLQNLNQPLALNVIVLFTDGNADSFAATIPSSLLKTKSDTRYDAFNTTTSETVGATGCSSTDSFSGVILDVDGAQDATGYTGGMYSMATEPITWSSPYTSSTGVPFPASEISAPSGSCSFAGSSPYGGYPYNSLQIRYDVAYLPSTDYYGNSLTGHWALDYYPSNDPNYANKPRIDTPNSVMNAALNAADNQANTIRSNTTLNPVIYAIGLGGTQYQQINTDFLERIANDPRSSNYNSSQQTGEFIYCTASGLAAAFQQIASQILRLSS